MKSLNPKSKNLVCVTISKGKKFFMNFPHIQFGSKEILDIMKDLAPLTVTEYLLNSYLTAKVLNNSKNSLEEWCLLSVNYKVRVCSKSLHALDS